MASMERNDRKVGIEVSAKTGGCKEGSRPTVFTYDLLVVLPASANSDSIEVSAAATVVPNTLRFTFRPTISKILFGWSWPATEVTQLITHQKDNGKKNLLRTIIVAVTRCDYLFERQRREKGATGTKNSKICVEILNF